MKNPGSPLLRGGRISLLLGPPVFGVCAAAMQAGVAEALVITALLYIPGAPLTFGLGCLMADGTARAARALGSWVSPAFLGAGIGAVLVTAATAALRVFGSYVADGAYALGEGLVKASTLWILVASITAGSATGAWIGSVEAERDSRSQDRGRSAVVLGLLLLLAGVIYVSVWEIRTLYQLPSTF